MVVACKRRQEGHQGNAFVILFAILFLALLLLLSAPIAAEASLHAESAPRVEHHHQECPPGGAVISFSYVGYVVGLAVIVGSAAGAHILVSRRHHPGGTHDRR